MMTRRGRSSQSGVETGVGVGVVVVGAGDIG